MAGTQTPYTVQGGAILASSLLSHHAPAHVLWFFLEHRARHHLHIVFATSPVGSAFRTRCRQFPSLVNCMTIDWFSPWPPEALLGVSVRILQNLSLVTAPTAPSVAKTSASGAAVASSTGASDVPGAQLAKPAATVAAIGAADSIVLRVAKMCVEMHKGVEVAAEQLFQEQQRR